MQGPFSREFNQAVFAAYRAEVVVTKNSGAIGGTDEKLMAAMELGLKLIVVERPALVPKEAFCSISDLVNYVKGSFANEFHS